MSDAFWNRGRRWSEDDDHCLLVWGWCMGVDFITEHDLGRPAAAGRRRLGWLRKHRPDLVAKHWDAEALAENHAIGKAEHIARLREERKAERLAAKLKLQSRSHKASTGKAGGK